MTPPYVSVPNSAVFVAYSHPSTPIRRVRDIVSLQNIFVINMQDLRFKYMKEIWVIVVLESTRKIEGHCLSISLIELL